MHRTMLEPGPGGSPFRVRRMRAVVGCSFWSVTPRVVVRAARCALTAAAAFREFARWPAGGFTEEEIWKEDMISGYHHVLALKLTSRVPDK